MKKDLEILKKTFGFDKYLSHQEEIIADILSGKDVLTIMPTGGGKSLCYQLPALMFGGMTIVVSPLIALMQSQVSQLKLLNVKAGSLNSSNTYEENQYTLNLLQTNKLKILYAAPERLVKQETIQLLKDKNIFSSFKFPNFVLNIIQSNINWTVIEIENARANPLIPKISLPEKIEPTGISSFEFP